MFLKASNVTLHNVKGWCCLLHSGIAFAETPVNMHGELRIVENMYSSHRSFRGEPLKQRKTDVGTFVSTAILASEIKQIPPHDVAESLEHYIAMCARAAQGLTSRPMTVPYDESQVWQTERKRVCGGHR